LIKDDQVIDKMPLQGAKTDTSCEAVSSRSYVRHAFEKSA
jgi:hypothetical protein